MAMTPAGALRLPADARTQPIHPGATSFRIWRADGPLAIYGFVWDRSQKLLAPRVTVGNDLVPGLETTSRQVLRLANQQSTPVAAVNGDFFIMSGPGQGATIGLCVSDGELVGLSYDRPAFVVRGDGSYSIGPVASSLRLSGGGLDVLATRVNNSRGPDCLTLYTPTWGAGTSTGADGVEVVLRWAEAKVSRLTPRLDTWVEVAQAPVTGVGNQAIPPDAMVLSGSGVFAAKLARLTAGQRLRLEARVTPAVTISEAVGGSEVLLAGGKTVYGGGPNEPRHPRTAIGFDDQQAVAVVVDGRQAGHSMGMTLPELARLMASLGCREALNLDGGGSATCWVRGEILNRPSDGHERPVANALALVSRAPAGRASRIVLDPPGPWRLTPGASLEVRATVTDDRLNPVPGRTVDSMALDRPLATVRRGVLTAGGKPGSGTLTVTGGGLSARVEVTVIDRLTRLECQPARLALVPGEAANVAVTGRDAQGRTVVVDAEALRWSLPAAAGSVRRGVVTAGAEGGRGALLVEGFGAQAEVPVVVAAPVAVESFDGPGEVAFDAIPDSVTGSAVKVRGEGAGAFCRLTYHLGAGAATRAAYVRLDRRIDPALALRARVRGDGKTVWLRAVLIDGNGQRSLHDLFSGRLGSGWIPVECRLPDGLKAPLTWHSVYVVATTAEANADGQVDWDQLEVLRAGSR